MIQRFFMLLIGHVFADFCFQTPYVSKYKRRFVEEPEGSGNKCRNPHWFWALGAHALMHAGVVWIITGRPLLALIEFISHAVIDFAKCEGWINYHMDQSLHIVYKLIYAVAK